MSSFCLTGCVLHRVLVRVARRAILLALVVMLGCGLCAQEPAWVEAARGVIARFAGAEVAQSLTLQACEAEAGRPICEVSENGRCLRGSSAVALCKGFYANTLRKGAGICSWSGSRFDAERAFAPGPDFVVRSPYRHVQYLNVVTFGYTLAFWDEARWMQELDWMALHGFDMALVLMANEAIAERVWRAAGLTDSEIEATFPGPAHLPWFRMGNLSARPDAPLGRAWRERSVRLQHAVMDRMAQLGMTPIVPAFAGFVPEALGRLYPKATLHRTEWSGFHSWFLSPEDPLFRRLGRAFVEAWEAEFGRCTYYLADSFNEMHLPWQGEAEIAAHLRRCGESVGGAILDANPRAVWVLQGWMLGYQRDIWSAERFAALLSAIPPAQTLILDMANDYNAHFWRNGSNWELHRGFGGRPWIWSTIPNMGGKCAQTGVLAFYANGHLPALASANRGNLWGYGTAPEGIENNEVLYELIADAAWRDTELDLRAWLRNYSLCRYGACPDRLMDYWDGLLATVYGAFTDHPRYAWQLANCTRGTVYAEAAPLRAARQAFLACEAELSHSPLYRADALAERAFLLSEEAEEALRAGNPQAAIAPLEAADRLLADHPLFRLDRYLAQARAAAEGNEPLAERYAQNAYRLITLWGPPITDYAARLWSGLIRQYYLPRLRRPCQ